MRSRQMIGVELPGPGCAIFQRMFFSADHSRGRLTSVVWPSPFGPRQAGQLSARATLATSRMATRTRGEEFMTRFLGGRMQVDGSPQYGVRFAERIVPTKRNRT